MSAAPAWSLKEPEPTNVVALWAGDGEPGVDDVLGALSDDHAFEVLETVEHDDSRVAWSVAVRYPDLQSPVVLWSERAQPMAAEACRALSVPSCSWIVGAETLLRAEDPLSDYIVLMRAFARRGDLFAAALDVNTTRWFTHDEMDGLFAQPVEPAADVLWIVQGVRSERPGSEGCVWLHTHGLWRCGQPELEMLEVGANHADTASELLNDVAALVVESGAPAPGVALEIGTSVHIVLQPWQEIVSCMNDGVPGGPRDRADDVENAHIGARAVICADQPVGASRQLWIWPEEATRRLASDEAGVYRTRRETQRQATLARAAWSDVCDAFAETSRGDLDSDGRLGGQGDRCATMNAEIVFVLKAGFTDDDDPTSREHLWFQVDRFEEHRAHGRLLNQPVAARRLSKGEAIWIPRDDVSDWRVITPSGSFGPTSVQAMWDSLR